MASRSSSAASWIGWMGCCLCTVALLLRSNVPQHRFTGSTDAPHPGKKVIRGLNFDRPTEALESPPAAVSTVTDRQLFPALPLSQPSDVYDSRSLRLVDAMSRELLKKMQVHDQGSSRMRLLRMRRQRLLARKQRMLNHRTSSNPGVGPN